MAKAKRIVPRHTPKGYVIGPKDTTFGRSVVLVNPSERAYKSRYYRDMQGHDCDRFVLWVDSHAPRYLMIWTSSLEDAIETAGEWLAEHAPGLLCDDAVNEAYQEAYDAAIAEGKDEDTAREEAYETAESDVTRLDNGHYLESHEWGIALENPSRAELDEFLYPPGLSWKERTHCVSSDSPWRDCRAIVNRGDWPEYSYGAERYAREHRADSGRCAASA